MDLRDWLFTEARFTTDAGEFLLKICEKLNEKAFGLMRGMLGVRTLHPEVSVEFYMWQRDERRVGAAQETIFTERRSAGLSGGISHTSLNHGVFESDSYKKSPLFVVIEQGVWVRCKITADQSEFKYPILRDLQAVGATDYVAAPMRFTAGPLSTFTWVTDKPGGFSDEEITELESLMPFLAGCFEIYSLRHTTDALVRTYLGADPGSKVLAGQVKPGDVQRLEAAIWFSDMRGFTRLSTELSSRDLVATLNDYFSVFSAVVTENGGEILKFIGDAMLVIFPVREGRAANEVCEAAAHAAATVQEKLKLLNGKRAEKKLPVLDHGIGLHFGYAEYGNIGAPGRLDFTVIGKDVNLAARIHSLTGELGYLVVATEAVAQLSPSFQWKEMGVRTLKGISEGVKVFVLPGTDA